MSELTVTLTLRMTAEQRAELQRQADDAKRKPSDLARLLIADGLAAGRTAEGESLRV